MTIMINVVATSLLGTNIMKMRSIMRMGILTKMILNCQLKSKCGYNAIKYALDDAPFIPYTEMNGNSSKSGIHPKDWGSGVEAHNSNGRFDLDSDFTLTQPI